MTSKKVYAGSLRCTHFSISIHFSGPGPPPVASFFSIFFFNARAAQNTGQLARQPCFLVSCVCVLCGTHVKKKNEKKMRQEVAPVLRKRYYPLQASAGPPLKNIISHTAQTSPPDSIQQSRIRLPPRHISSGERN